MKPTHHAVASGIISLAFALWTRSFPGTVACFLSGIFIDVDHFLDYWVAKKKLLFTYRQLYDYCAFEKNGKLILLFHSYELIALAWMVYYVYRPDMVGLGILVGVSMHVLLDTIFNPLRPFVYFLWYRLRVGFDKKHIFPESYYRSLP